MAHPNYKILFGSDPLRESTIKDTIQKLEKGRKYMDESFLKNLSIGEVAKQANLSESHFFRRFRQFFGITPHKYLLCKRLRYAHQLLSERKLSIAKIADKCCFADAFAFSKSFKRKFGISPSKIKA